MGLILDVREKVKDWYLVELPADGNGTAVRGYIHKSVVQEFDDQAPGAKTEPVVTTKLSGTIPAVTPAKSKKSTEAAGVSRKRLYIRLGGGYGTKSFVYDNSWSFDMYQESGQASEKYSVTASGAAFDVGLGFMFTRSVGVELSFIPASGKSEGTFSASFPHPFYLNYPRTGRMAASSTRHRRSTWTSSTRFPFLPNSDSMSWPAGPVSWGSRSRASRSLNGRRPDILTWT
jgi:hypothetical protein